MCERDNGRKQAFSGLIISNIILIVFISSPLLADPWGKDAELAKKSCLQSPQKRIMTPFFGQIGEMLIAFHQQVISPADGPRSNFIPSSSQYTLDAMRKYGFFRGWVMGCDRLMRENDDAWVYDEIPISETKTMKYNPVP